MISSSANRQRCLVALVQILGLSVWFSATAVVPSLRAEWGLGSAAAGWLTASVQIGFATGAVTSALLNLADRVRPQHLLAVSSGCAAVCTAALAFFAHGLSSAIPLRLATGVVLAGVYPVGMKLTASWSGSADRGRAFGVLIGALTLGSAFPHLINGFGPLPWRTVLATAATLSAVAAVLALLAVVPGPHLDTTAVKLNPRHALAMFADRRLRLTNIGYLGHMWELYALWTWLAMFILAGRQQRGDGAASSTGIIAFSAIGVAGVAGCLLGGWASDRFGRRPAAVTALAISAACCIASPLFFTVPTVVLIVFLLVWGAAVIADSGVFSTSVSENADKRLVGTALTAQTAIGFLLTVVTIHLVPLAADLIGWRYAFLLLAPGPLIGAVAMTALRPLHVHPLQVHPMQVHPPQNEEPNTIRSAPIAGQTAELSRTIGDDDIALFTLISGDHNPLHYDEAAAKASRFGEIVVQGGVTSAILNAVVAERLPGPGTVFLNTNWHFKAPVRPGDTITGRVEVISVRTDKPITTLKTTVTRDDGTVVLDGTAVCYTMDIAGGHDR